MSRSPSPRSLSLFADGRLIARGPLPELAQDIAAHAEAPTCLLFDDQTGAVVDIDPRGGAAGILYRAEEEAQAASEKEKPTRGRPKLGVVAKEVTLLPRHWSWLSTQRGGASATLRRLVDDARKATEKCDQARARQDAAFRFLQSIAGDFPGFEEAIRSLYAGDMAAFETNMAGFPEDIRAHALTLIGQTPDLAKTDNG